VENHFQSEKLVDKCLLKNIYEDRILEDQAEQKEVERMVQMVVEKMVQMEVERMVLMVVD
jgi:hypothetical protein